jgi:hypothetical protein
MATLEEKMQALGAEHGFHAVSVGFNTKIIREHWSAHVHWTGFSRNGLACANGSGKTPEEALENAASSAVQCRAPYVDEGERADRIEHLRAQLAELEGQ